MYKNNTLSIIALIFLISLFIAYVLKNILLLKMIMYIGLLGLFPLYAVFYFRSALKVFNEKKIPSGGLSFMLLMINLDWNNWKKVSTFQTYFYGLLFLCISLFLSSFTILLLIKIARMIL